LLFQELAGLMEKEITNNGEKGSLTLISLSLLLPSINV